MPDMSDEILDRRYDGICISSPLDLAHLNQRNLTYLTSVQEDTQEYRDFTVEINHLDLAINAFENLLMWCDQFHEKSGVLDFPIDMPREFFRFPCFNNSGDRFHCSPMLQEEGERIGSLIESARPVFRVRNDENIIRELFSRLDFMSLISFFEAFLEELHFRFLENSGDRKKSVDYIRKHHLAEVFEEITAKISSDILHRLEKVFPAFLKAIHYFYLMRNIHTHKLGVLSNYALQKGLKYGSIEKRLIEVEGKTLEEYYPVFQPLCERPLTIGEYLPVRSPVNLLRVLVRESSFVVNHHICKEKGKGVSPC